MTYKDFCEDADITIAVHIYVNDDEVFTSASSDIDTVVSELGRAERMQVIEQALSEQYNDLSEADYREL